MTYSQPKLKVRASAMTETSVLKHEKLASILLPEPASIIEAMKVIDQGAAQIAMVVDEERKLLGVVTDGDLRRAILSGASLDAPIAPFVVKTFHKVSGQVGRTEALDLMKCHCIEQLPIVDDSGRLQGLHLLNELIQPQSLPNAAIVLAGGKGTRLGSLTRSTPKPMIRIVGRPILERIVLHLIGNGISEIYLSVNYLAEQIEEHFGDGSKFGCKIFYLRETKPLGTGGPLALIPDHSRKHPVLVMNGDLITEFDIAQMLARHDQQNNAITMGVRTYSHSVPFGCVQTDGDRITSLLEKPTLQETINAGIYVISPELLADVPASYYPITKLLELALARNQRLGIHPIDSWIDVGQPDQLDRARGIENQGLQRIP